MPGYDPAHGDHGCGRSRVQLQVLDWGSKGKPDTMVLLTGLGDDAHIFDEFAFQFTDYFHVIGITRRGYLPSSQPDDGYDVATRALDDMKVLDTLGIRKAVFVGHSIAASELSRIATAYKDRVEKLVYLDAFDLAERFKLPEVPGPPFIDVHPVDVETRVQAALESARPYLKSHGGDVKLAAIEDGVVHVHLQGSCGSCAGSTETLKNSVEAAVYGAAPEVAEVVAESMPAPAHSNLVVLRAT